jgi:hypothetical protein
VAVVRRTWADATRPLPYPRLDQQLVQYKDPEHFDQLTGIQKKLDETTEIMVSSPVASN